MNRAEHHQGVKNDKFYLRNGTKCENLANDVAFWFLRRFCLFWTQTKSQSPSLTCDILFNIIISPIKLTETFNVFVMTLPISTLCWGVVYVAKSKVVALMNKRGVENQRGVSNSTGYLYRVQYLVITSFDSIWKFKRTNWNLFGTFKTSCLPLNGLKSYTKFVVERWKLVQITKRQTMQVSVHI